MPQSFARGGLFPLRPEAQGPRGTGAMTLLRRKLLRRAGPFDYFDRLNTNPLRTGRRE